METSRTNERQLNRTRVTGLAAVLALLAVVALAVWTLGSGFSDLPSQIFTSRQNVELSLPYRGICQGVTVSVNGREVPTVYKDIKAGLARFSVALAPGRHQLEIRFDTVLPGWNRNYPLAVVVDQTPPTLALADHPLLRALQSTTTDTTVPMRGRLEAGARLYVGDQLLSADAEGVFSEELPLQPGWNHLLLRAEDQAGNRTSKKFAIFSDVQNPEIVWHVAPGKVFKENSARLDISVHDDGALAAVTGQVDGKPVVWHRKPNDRWLGMTEVLGEGRHDVSLKVADRAGRVSTSKREILIDSSEVLGEAVLGLGARGADVSQLNERLHAAGHLPAPPAGSAATVFSSATRTAIETVQRNEGFAITGRADLSTLAALGPRLYVNLSAFSLILETPGKPQRRFTIASGSPEFPTPTGRFTIYEKVENPTWLPPKSDWARDAKPIEPGPDNPLGTRWIGLDWGGVGIHGTNAPWTVGSAASHGCMRMEMSQVEELFELVELGTSVVIMGGSENDPLLQKFWPRS